MHGPWPLRTGKAPEPDQMGIRKARGKGPSQVRPAKVVSDPLPARATLLAAETTPGLELRMESSTANGREWTRTGEGVRTRLKDGDGLFSCFSGVSVADFFPAGQDARLYGKARGRPLPGATL